jgi:hypothetical protein
MLALREQFYPLGAGWQNLTDCVQLHENSGPKNSHIVFDTKCSVEGNNFVFYSLETKGVAGVRKIEENGTLPNCRPALLLSCDQRIRSFTTWHRTYPAGQRHRCAASPVDRERVTRLAARKV